MIEVSLFLSGKSSTFTWEREIRSFGRQSKQLIGSSLDVFTLAIAFESIYDISGEEEARNVDNSCLTKHKNQRSIRSVRETEIDVTAPEKRKNPSLSSSLTERQWNACHHRRSFRHCSAEQMVDGITAFMIVLYRCRNKSSLLTQWQRETKEWCCVYRCSFD